MAKPRTWSKPRKALYRMMPFVLIRRSELLHLRRSVERYRVLRGHMRKDGRVKSSLSYAEALKLADRLTKQTGKQYTPYECRLCSSSGGRYHVGNKRE